MFFLVVFYKLRARAIRYVTISRKHSCKLSVQINSYVIYMYMFIVLLGLRFLQDVLFFKWEIISSHSVRCFSNFCYTLVLLG